MIIELGKVSPDGSRYEGEEPPEVLGLDKEERVRVDTPVAYDLFVQRVGRELVVRGSWSVSMSFACVRCTDFFSTSIGDSSFLRVYEISEGMESVDVTPDIREDVLLGLPAYPVCRPECAGLCPQCGRNLNTGRCDCKPPSGDGRWGALNGLNLS